ncbi:hypothetical protein ACQPZ2_06165 [Nocardia pseudovaccinii]|uniref:hypothetical protein n=1 Tax=Nocardia pseudovaccinii TaxID=189540 RepID=UPI003D93BB42
MLKRLAVAVLIVAGLSGALAGTASAGGNFLGRYYWLNDCLDAANRQQRNGNPHAHCEPTVINGVEVYNLYAN